MNQIDINDILTSSQTVFALLLIIFLLMYIAFDRKSSKKH